MLKKRRSCWKNAVTPPFFGVYKKILCGGSSGEVPQYFVKNSHPAIIPPETFDLAQSEIRRRKESGQRVGANPFVGRIFCGECGAVMARKLWHSTDKYRRIVWQCNAKYERGKRGGPQCPSSHVTEDDIKAAFVAAFNRLAGDKERYIAAFDETLPIIADTTALDKAVAKAARERDALDALMRDNVRENARTEQNQEAYNRTYNELLNQRDTAQKRLEAILQERQDRMARKERVLRFLDILRQSDGLLTEFDEALFCATVDRVTVHSARSMTFTFRDGVEIQADF